VIRGTPAAANKNAVNEQYAQVQPIDGIFPERKHLTPSRNKAGIELGSLYKKTRPQTGSRFYDYCD
jgi:hypothetical protein